MQFKLFTLATVFLTAGSAYGAAQVEASDVVGDLTQLTQSVTNTNGILQQLTLLNAVFQIPASISGLTSILSQITEFDSALNLGSGTLSTPSTVDQTQICSALTTGKLSVLNTLGLGSIVAEVLSTGLTQVDSFVNGIIAQVPTCAPNSTAQLGSLETTLATAIKALGGTVPALPGLPTV